MKITPDLIVLRQWGPIGINATLVFTWLIMALLVIGSRLITRRLVTHGKMSRMQNLLEIIVTFIRKQISDVGNQEPDRFLPFIGTLFLFIAVSNLLSIIPGYLPPTGSLSTTTALALCVFKAVPLYGISTQGAVAYFKNYAKPSIFMLPLNVMGELSRTLALAVRLFGNVMSGTMIGGILLSVTPLIFPVVMQAFGLLTGLIQAYIFAILATVFISAATEVQSPGQASQSHQEKGE
ncbi:F0F1 ATP synthase subunit A [Desulforhabdus sp. TSK]|uniref:F0F1 ATP synthase subunit A n=1 Tax=Desulforhabdus sp. TSK TaxID=2925014 RepID=UPI001FC7E5EA|nr:F0F1 ATP synthase subunit A [Desulforhabdus sp. TSK]GKT07795.1 ATP synthase subunit a [Desulforhabdus sp. TSK]